MAAGRLDRDVALKFTRALAAIKHSNVVQVFDEGECEGRPLVVLEHVDGETLRDRLEGHRKLRDGTPPEKVRGLFVQVCERGAVGGRLSVVR